ncbi:MAG: hypothetical protein B6242_11030 [Anaerolineaceae bacterium 4572_78]|nr:MAG: hypothetical protein B6242_11030 [Anaerolineaceae bacterium 4572_78]
MKYKAFNIFLVLFVITIFATACGSEAPTVDTVVMAPTDTPVHPTSTPMPKTTNTPVPTSTTTSLAVKNTGELPGGDSSQSESEVTPTEGYAIDVVAELLADKLESNIVSYDEYTTITDDLDILQVNNPTLEVGGLQEQSYRLQVDQTQHFLSATLP